MNVLQGQGDATLSVFDKGEADINAYFGLQELASQLDQSSGKGILTAAALDSLTETIEYEDEQGGDGASMIASDGDGDEYVRVIWG